MKKILSIFVLLVLTLSASAQNSAAARKVLDQATSAINVKTGAKANFTYYGPKATKTNGTLAIKGKKFQATTPQAIVWYNGKTQWTYMKSTQEVNVSTPNNDERMRMNPYTFINLYKNGYKLSMKNQEHSYEVHLQAYKKSNIPELYIIVDKNTHIPSHVKFLQNGAWSTIVISGFRKVKLPDSSFTFNRKEFPHAEIIDLR